MILDTLENVYRYRTLHQGFAKASAFLLRPDLKDLPVERYGLEGDRIYAMVSRDPGGKKEDGRLESHQKYIDIQLVLTGIDDMGWKPRVSCKQPTGEYDPQADVRFFSDEPDAWLAVRSGTFAIFFPDDAHLPLISSGEIHKVVVKVAVDLV